MPKYKSYLHLVLEQARENSRKEGRGDTIIFIVFKYEGCKA